MGCGWGIDSQAGLVDHAAYFSGATGTCLGDGQNHFIQLPGPPNEQALGHADDRNVVDAPVPFLAIIIEEEAKDRYEEFVDQMVKHHTPEAEEFFRTMVVNESKHEAELTSRRISLCLSAT